MPPNETTLYQPIGIERIYKSADRKNNESKTLITYSHFHKRKTHGSSGTAPAGIPGQNAAETDPERGKLEPLGQSTESQNGNAASPHQLDGGASYKQFLQPRVASGAQNEHANIMLGDEFRDTILYITVHHI